VEARKLDGFLELFGRWQEAHSFLAHAAWSGKLGQPLPFVRDLSRLYELSCEMQAAALSLRRASLRRSFQKVDWLVRALAPRLGKTARLVTQGQDLELDSETVAQLDAVLLHLARNALVHGLETPEVRRAAAKAETGTLWLSARRCEEALVLELRDDGTGLNRRKILDCAVAKGLAAPGAALSQRDLVELILRPGFSTAETATEVSGRGIGLDAVKRAVERLKGVLKFESSPGAGTTVQIYLPQSGVEATPAIELAGGWSVRHAEDSRLVAAGQTPAAVAQDDGNGQPPPATIPTSGT
jgi:two-component system, chemotaxis family, sensor kinase CheA